MHIPRFKRIIALRFLLFVLRTLLPVSSRSILPFFTRRPNTPPSAETQAVSTSHSYRALLEHCPQCERLTIEFAVALCLLLPKCDRTLCLLASADLSHLSNMQVHSPNGLYDSSHFGAACGGAFGNARNSNMGRLGQPGTYVALNLF